jgi:hypothetical protein
MLSIIINGVTIANFLDKYQVQIKEVFDTQSSFTAIDGTSNSVYLGDQRIIEVDFEPMSQSQMQTLFSAIKENRESIEITYVDPQLGETTKNFTCSNLPAATYFEAEKEYVYNKEIKSDNETVLFWTVPTITFEETEASWSSG